MNEFIVVTIAGKSKKKAILKNTIKTFKQDTYSEDDRDCVYIEYIVNEQVSWVKVNETFEYILDQLSR